jgi:hypothetical protein
MAGELWAGGRPLAGSLAERHLRLRRIGRSPGAALRFHPAAPVAVYARAGPRRPALLAAITDDSGTLTSVEMGFHAPASATRQRMNRESNRAPMQQGRRSIEVGEGAGVGNHYANGRLLRA